MERLRLDRDGAFDRLRDEARASRRRISEVAEELLQAVEKLNFVPHTPGSDSRRSG